MNDNDIIKALGYCFAVGDCEHCVYAEKPCQELMADALDLINRQKAEIERLNHIRAELSKENEEQDQAIINALHHMKVVRAEAIKKFAERLRNKFFNYYDGLTENTSKSNHNGDTLMFYEVADMIVDCIDNTMEEMTEEKE